MDILTLNAILADCRFEDFPPCPMWFRTEDRGGVLLLSLLARDGRDDHDWNGRKWFISQHATRSEVVQTVLKAILTALEHEAREHFRYKGRAIFAPHFSVDGLVALVDREQEDRRDDRTDRPHLS